MAGTSLYISSWTHFSSCVLEQGASAFGGSKFELGEWKSSEVGSQEKLDGRLIGGRQSKALGRK